MSFGALGSMLSSVAGSVVGGALDLGKAMWQNTQNKKAATKAYEREVALMNIQNAYNTPAAQMERYKEAGLNPNLIYGQQNLSASASSVPMSKGASVGSSHLDFEGALDRNLRELQLNMNLKKLGQDLQLGQGQIQQVEAQTDLLRASTLKANAEAESQLWNLGIAMRAGLRNQSPNVFDVGREWMNRFGNLVHDTVFGHPSGKNSIYDQIWRYWNGDR